MEKDRRTYVGELEWALQQIGCAHSDRNPNRAAQIQAFVDYGLAVARAKRGREPIPPRPVKANLI